MRTAEHRKEAQSPPRDEASPTLSTRLALAQPSTAAAKAIQSKHGSRHSRLNRTKPTPRNKLDHRAHHVTQLAVLKSRILNIITNILLTSTWV